jgi:hypothetical protein
VKAFIDELTDEEVASIVAGMKEVAERGLPAAKHLRGDIYEVRADAATRSFRVRFSTEATARSFSPCRRSRSARRRLHPASSSLLRAASATGGRGVQGGSPRSSLAIALKLWR